jgi:hypothetical protein
VYARKEISLERILGGAVRGGGGQNFGGGEFEDEAGAGRGVVFDAQAATMLGDDTGGNGEAEAGAAIFG